MNRERATQALRVLERYLKCLFAQAVPVAPPPGDLDEAREALLDEVEKLDKEGQL